MLAYMERTVRAVLEKAASGAEGDVEGVQRELSKYGFRYVHVYQWYVFSRGSTEGVEQVRFQVCTCIYGEREASRVSGEWKVLT